MKKQLAFALILSTFINPCLYAGTQKMELGAIGIGGLMFAKGLHLLNKSTKKKGTTGQALVGTAFTVGGFTIMTQGPRYFRVERSNNWLGGTWLGKKWKQGKYEVRKKLAISNFNDLAESEDNTGIRLAYRIYTTLLQYDPFDMIPVPDKEKVN